MANIFKGYEESTFNELEELVANPNKLFTIPAIDSVSDLLGMVANIVFGIGFAFGFIGLAVSFVKLTTSRGDAKAVDTAKNGLTWSVLAILVTIFAIAIKYIFLDLAGVKDKDLLNAL